MPLAIFEADGAEQLTDISKVTVQSTIDYVGT